MDNRERGGDLHEANRRPFPLKKINKLSFRMNPPTGGGMRNLKMVKYSFA